MRNDEKTPCEKTKRRNQPCEKIKFQREKKRHAKRRHLNLNFVVFSRGVFSSFRQALFCLVVFPPSVISSFRGEITPGEKTKMNAMRKDEKTK